MRQRPSRSRFGSWALILATGLTLAAAAMPEGARAHVDIDVGDGRYVMGIGFRDEPAFLGQPNAIFIEVAEYATGGTEPVDGLAETLTAEVSRDGKTLGVPLVPMGDGVYEGRFVPTAVGDYTFRKNTKTTISHRSSQIHADKFKRERT